MEVIGLTGGIGTGKSTVAAILKDLGAAIIDADEAARAVVEPGTPGLAEIVEEFGAEIAPEGRLDRRRLAAIVFNHPAALARLNAITHPRVREWMAERSLIAFEEGAEVVIQDVPLLFENGLEALFRGVILVYAPVQEQVSRLLARGMREDDARARIAAQMPIEEKRRRATWVIDNSGPLERTRPQVERLWTEITAETGSGP